MRCDDFGQDQPVSCFRKVQWGTSMTMKDNPYSPPDSIASQSKMLRDTSSFAWWEEQRLRYNLGLVIAGPLAFTCYVFVCLTLLPRVLAPSEIEVNGLTTLVQGVGYLFMMGVANLLYFVGPIAETLIRPSNPDRFRNSCYWLGFWFSVLLPFCIPILLTVEILAFPEVFKHR